MSTALEPEKILSTGQANGLGGRLGRIMVQFAFLGLLFATWHFLVHFELVSRIVLPEPWGVVTNYVENLKNIVTGGWMLSHVTTTLTEAALGFLVSLVLGITIGALVSELSLARLLLRPYILALNATPRIAFAPLALVWFGFGVSSKVALAASIAIFPVIFGTVAGLMATEAEEVRLMRAYGATRWQAFTKLRIWVAVPFIFSGLEMAMGLAFLGAVAGEFLGGSAGLGYLVVVSLETLNLSQAFAVILLLSTLGFIAHRAMLMVQAKAVYWRSGDRGPL